jgi:hypothetical protein
MAKTSRKKNAISLAEVNPLSLKGTADDIALVEGALADMEHVHSVWTSVLEGWKRKAGLVPLPIPHAAPSAPIAQMPAASTSDLSIVTLPNLVNAYLTHQRSQYGTLTLPTRKFYDTQLRRLLDAFGDTPLIAIKKPTIQAVYDTWTKNGTDKLANGHAGIAVLRVIVNFGATELDHPECVRLSVILRSMRIKVVKPRTERITAAHVVALRKVAHEKGYPSVALAQAFQFEGKLKQKQILGEWLPIGEGSEPGKYISNGKKWVPGLLWDEIGEDLILRRKSKDGTEIVQDLNNCEMIKEELALVQRNSNGPAVVVIESSGLPWDASYFRQCWRKLATEAGIPKEIRSTDTPDDSDEPEGDDIDVEAELDEELGRTSEAEASKALH